MNKRTKAPARSLTKKVARKTTTSKKPKAQANHPIHAQRNEPKHRGIHKDAIQAGRAPTGASTCIACDRKIEGNHPRWGIKYAGNPLSIPVLPLYGSHPMVQWCHAGGCGLAFLRYKDLASEAPAARTCHACQDTPDKATTKNSVRLLCGASPKGKKIRHHVFHISCWIKSIQNSSDDVTALSSLLVRPEDIVTKKQQRGLSWADLTQEERKFVCNEFQRMGVQ